MSSCSQEARETRNSPIGKRLKLKLEEIPKVMFLKGTWRAEARKKREREMISRGAFLHPTFHKVSQLPRERSLYPQTKTEEQ